MPVLTLPQASALRESFRSQKRNLLLANGIFDLLHAGHLDYLEKARALGEALFVGVNGDDAARKLKGAGRPIVPAAERARLVAALSCVDAAVVFDELTADNLLRAMRPEHYAKGGDYSGQTLPERDTAEAVGAAIKFIPLLPGHSTTALLARIRANLKES